MVPKQQYRITKISYEELFSYKVFMHQAIYHLSAIVASHSSAAKHDQTAILN